MFETLFGAEMPLVLRFFIAFVVVLGLIGATAFVVRRFGGDRLGAAAARGRQPRLAVVDAASVDGRRRLILIRRDNVEHLLMIGGPTDIVVEPNIVRAAAAAREAPPTRLPGAPEPMTRAVGEGSMWPLQPHPEPAAPAVSMPPRPQRPTVQDEPPWPAESDSPMPMPSPRPTRTADPLAGLAFELARGPAQPEPSAPPPRPARPPFPTRTPLSERPPPRERQRFEPRPEPKPELLLEPRAEPLPAAPTEPPFPSAEQNLAEMAHRLETALRRPARPMETAEPGSTPEPSEIPEPSEPKPEHSEALPAPAEQKPAAPRSLYDSLEQEMASLLGRPPDKP